MALQILVALDDAGKINLSWEGEDSKIALLGLLDVARDIILHPPQEPPQLLVALGALPQTNGDGRLFSR